MMGTGESRSDSLDIPTTVLLGRSWSGAGRAVRRLARRLASRLQHDVDTCDLAEPGEPLSRLARAEAERGARRLVLLPVALEDGGLADARINIDCFRRVHRGRAPAADDIARMLGDRARDASRTLASGSQQPAQVAVVIATGGGANPASNAEVARRARLVYEAHGFGEVTCAFIGLTTPSVGDAIARAARLGARGVVVVPHLLFDSRGHRHLVQQARAAATAARVEVAIARTLDTHPGLVWALVRRHLEALSDGDLATTWVNPDLQRIFEHSHGPGLHEVLETRMAQILPARYRDFGRVVSSAPMGAAPLQRTDDGRVAWDKMWQGFCELALAGGPPHRGTLLEAVSSHEAEADPARYAAVRAELARGLAMVTGLPLVLDGPTGWIGLRCDDEEMAIWLMRAIVVENVMVRREGAVLCLPVGCHFTLEGEIKNVVTVVAKTYHYWKEHRAAREA